MRKWMEGLDKMVCHTLGPYFESKYVIENQSGPYYNV